MTKISIQEVHAIMSSDTNCAFIDVRSVDEFARGHAKGFVNVPLDDIALNTERVPKAETIYFMCHSGGRSFLATKLAISSGLNAVNVDGGFSAWQKAGLPVE